MKQIIDQTRKKAAGFYLKRELKERNRTVRYCSWNKASNIGFLFDATVPEEFEMVKKWFRELKEQKLRFKALGFYDAKEMPVMMHSKLEYDFFTRKQLKWYLKPDDSIVKNFIEEPFDLLINLSLNPKTPLVYVLALSNAGLKVGLYQKRLMEYYDLVIRSEPVPSLKDFFRLVESNLNKFDTPNA